MARRRSPLGVASCPGQMPASPRAAADSLRKGDDPVGLALIIAAGLAVMAASAMALVYAPREPIMGDVQRIFYFHVASAWVGFLAFGVALASGIAYLARRDRRWDTLAASSIEVGLAFMVMAVVTGALWARPVWGVFWTWEPRLTITAVQLLLYAAYLMLRASVDDGDQRARYAAVYSVVAFLTVPLSWFAIRWWRTIHPDLLTGGGGLAIAPAMLWTLAATVVSYTLLYAAIVRQRMRIETLSQEVQRLRYELEAGEVTRIRRLDDIV